MHDAPVTHHRVCTLCEALCGLEIRTQGENVLSIRGDELDEFSQGHICPKGNALQDLHADPERLRLPVRKAPDGSWERVGWDEALDDIAARIGAVQDEHGRDAVGVYVGNPSAHHLGAMLMLIPLLGVLDTRNSFSAASLDQMPHYLASMQLFGHMAMLGVPDLERTDLLLCFGGNPMASNGSLMSTGGFRRRARELRERGGRLVVFDPRRTETAKVADEHLFVRPGTDAWVLAAMLQVVFAEGLTDLGHLTDHTGGFEALREAVASFTPEDAERMSGVPAEDIRRLACEFAASPSAVAYGRMGACTQVFGGLTAWLLVVLNAVTGNLDSPGGMMFTTPAADPVPLVAGSELTGTHDTFRSRVRGLPETVGELPTAVLAEEIDTPGEGQIRALVVHAGNPVLSSPNGSRLDAALPGLDLLVCFDMYVSETSRHADYILPPPSPLETSEYDIGINIVAVRNHANFSPPVFPLPEGGRQDWEVLAGLVERLMARDGRAGRLKAAAFGRTVRALGADGMLDLLLRLGPYGHPASARALADRLLGANALTRGVWKAADHWLRRGRTGGLAGTSSGRRPAGVPATGLTLATLRANPHGLDLGPLEQRLPNRLYTESGRVELVGERYLTDLDRLRATLDEAPDDALILIGRRHLRSNNSWMHNSRRLVKGPVRCTAMLHPDDAAARGVLDGDEVRVASSVGEVRLPAEVTDAVMPGVVSIPHGWGHTRPGTGWSVAEEHAGVSMNDIVDGRVDPLSGTAVLNGVPVQVTAVRAAVAAD